MQQEVKRELEDLKKLNNEITELLTEAVLYVYNKEYASRGMDNGTLSVRSMFLLGTSIGAVI